MQSRFNLTNSELESLAKSPRVGLGLAPWASWESERTGFGLGLRRAARYPSFLPIFITSDHGVDPYIDMRDNELNPAFGVYLSWNARKVPLLREAGVNAHHCRHPYTYLPLDIPQSGPSEGGTLVFWPHSHSRNHEQTDPAKFVSSLMELPDYYRPFTICLQSYDIGLGLHTRLRKLGLPLTTAGDVNSQKYPYRLFHLLRNFQFTAGNTIGSHIYYCFWAGRPFRLVGQDSFQMKRLNASGKWEYSTLLEEYERLYPNVELRRQVDDFESSLELDLRHPLEMQVKYVREQMGLGSSMTRRDLRQIIWEQFYKNTKSLPSLYLRR